jgi:electron transfer flavoprotein alpha subunit
MTTLLLADHDDRGLGPATCRALTAAAALGAPVHVLVAGEGCRAAAEAAARLAGVERVLLAEDPSCRNAPAEVVAATLHALSPGYDAFVAAAGAVGKNAMPRLAALLDVMQVSEVVAVEAPDRFRRMIYAGSAVQTVQATESVRVLTVRASAFQPAEASDISAPIEPVAVVPSAAAPRFISAERVTSERPPLEQARIVVSGGRALGSAERFDAVVGGLAEALDAAVGASRAAVDAGYALNDQQVGQTGKIVAPDLYISLGISGAVQHLAGIKGSRVIVAVNLDPEAPIFRAADYAVISDLFAFAREFEAELAARGLLVRRGSPQAVEAA